MKLIDNINSWSEDKKRLILYADIMGFKDTIFSTSHLDLKKRLLMFRKSFEKKIEPLCTGDYMRFVQFSDSIIIVVNGIDSKMVNLVTKAGVILMHEAMKAEFPIKGVLAQGIFTYDKDNELYFGRPLVNAALLHDELYYYGIVVHHSAEKSIKKNISIDCPYMISPVNLKKGKTSHYHLIWNMMKINLSPGNITDDAIKWLEKIQESVSGAPRIYIDNTIAIIKNDSENFIISLDAPVAAETSVSGYSILSGN